MKPGTRWLSVLYKKTLPGLFLLCAPLLLFPQDGYLPPTVQDCLGAIAVCQPVYTTNSSYTGHGNVYPEIHNNSVCPLCMDGEKNDVFYVITVQNSGVLRFTLTPNNPDNDYDWSVFNMTEADCSQLYPNATALQVSCNSYGALGYNGPTGINTTLSDNTNCNGPGTTNGPAFNKDLIVLAGQTYLINISNWSTSQQSGYTLDFSSSTANIYDTVPPAIDSIQREIDCAGTNELYIRFTENMRCISINNQPGKFSLTGPGGTIPITGISSEDCGIGGAQSPNFILTTGVPLFSGSYSLSIIGNVMDLCSNAAEYESYPFNLTETNAPVAGAGNDTTVNNGAIITLHGSAYGGSGGYTFHWEPASLLVNPDVEDPVTINMGASTQFIINVTDANGCDGQDEVLVTVIGGPLAVSASASPSTLCNGSSSQLHAIPSGGSGNYTYAWTSSPAGFTSNLQDPVVYPAFTTTYTVQINDGFSNNTAVTTVTVDPLPVAAAGPDQTLPYGATVNLNGAGSGGSGSYGYTWNSVPPGYFSTLQNPSFVNLTQTTSFTLTVADQNTGCVSPGDEVVVTVTGSPLAAGPIAEDPVICLGAETQLSAMAGGGSGNYTYSWSSAPAGFSSTESDPVVQPLVTTTYFVTVSDGYNSAQGEVTVLVNPVPVIHLGPPDTTVCIYDTLTLDAGNPNCGYYWSNGATTRTIKVGSTGIGFETQTYTVHVLNAYSCADSATITVSFSFGACTRVEEHAGEADIRIRPNPNRGRFTVAVGPCPEELDLILETVTGQPLFRTRLRPDAAASTLHPVEVPGLARGLYIVRITGEQNRSIHRMIVN